MSLYKKLKGAVSGLYNPRPKIWHQYLKENIVEDPEALWKQINERFSGDKTHLYYRDIDFFHRKSFNTPEPTPHEGVGPESWSLVIQDMQDRDRMGERKYGTKLKPFNGRDQLVDLYSELLDAVVYLRSELYRKYNK